MGEQKVDDKLKEWRERWNNGDSKFVTELLELAEKYAKQNAELKGIIAQCRCEECGNEVGDNTEFSYGVLCKDCIPYEC